MAAPRLRPHNPEEFQRLLSWVRGARSLLEIGSRFGFPLVEMAHELAPGSRVVSVDLPDAEGWDDALSAQAISYLRDNIQLLKHEGYDAHLIVGDSHSPNIIESARAFGPYDVVFIDGDHSFEGVTEDWENYREMGSRIIFHDIRAPQPPEWMGLGVHKLWNDIRHKHQSEEFIAPGSKMGIGKIER